MRASSTVLGYKPISKTVLIISAVLTVMFAVIEPQATQHLGFVERILFWAYHIGVGLMAIAGASWILRQHIYSKYPRTWNVFFSGLVGSIIAIPFYVLVDSLFKMEQCEDEPWVLALEQSGLAGSLVAEFLEVFPTFFLVWLAINLPLFFAKPQVNTPPNEPPNPDPGAERVEDDDEKVKLELLKKEFFEKLPEVIGKELIAINSDLHYLNVTTVGGSALILGSLKTYVPALSELGMQTHRSHWVATAHVHKVHVSGDQAYCMMTNGTRVPISRSNKKAVKDFFGTGVKSSASSSSNIVPLAKKG